MNVLLLLLLSIAAYALVGVFYSRWIARHIDEDDTRSTPAETLADGRDFVATPTAVVFSHHYASIAGAGPIVGPIMALCFGWGPVWLWVMVGALFLGGVHDYLALHVSIREGGQSVIAIARKTLGNLAYGSFVFFAIVMIVLVTAVFLGLSCNALTSKLPLAALQLDATQTLLRAETVNGVQKVVVGGIASTSVIVITLFAPLVGWLYLKRKTPVWICSVLSILLCGVGIYAGLLCPVSVSPRTWMLCLAGYCLVASWFPVWMLLQSRDFINVHILYIGMAVLFVVLILLGVQGQTLQIDLANLQPEKGAPIPIWPLLFVTVACGAISGFHGLCASGTSSKQVRCESAARRVGYFGMLLEGLLAVGVIAAVGSAFTQHEFFATLFSNGKANPVVVFGLATGRIVHQAFPAVQVAIGTIFGMLLIEGFLVTTLDTAVRLNRYLLEELWRAIWPTPPKALMHPTTNSLISIACMLLLAWNNSAMVLWGVFASANQLLAALLLLLFAVWLSRKAKSVWFLLVPTVFMFVTTLTMLVWKLVADFWPNGKTALVVSDLLLLVLSVLFVVQAVRHRRPESSAL